MKLNTENVLIVGMAGAAVLLIVKATGLKIPGFSSLTGTVQTFAQSVWNPTRPSQGIAYDPVDPGAYIWTHELINGAIADYNSGSNSANNIPTLNQLYSDVITGGQQTVVKNPNTWW